MILIPEGDDVVDKGSDSSLGDGGSLGVSANVFDNFFGIGQFFPDVDIPLFGRRVGFIKDCWVHFYFARFDGIPKHGDDLISPCFFEGQVVEVRVVDPFGFTF